VKLLLFCAALALGLSACNTDNAPDPAPTSTSTSTDISIRVRNASPYTLATVQVNTSGGERYYSQLLPGQQSNYQTFTYAYRYAYIQAVVAGDALVLRPIDYVGERRLEPGQYTYVLDVTTTAGFRHLTLQLEKP
jgi:hypothetical protein